jgi:hypothetical protein
MIRFVCKHCGRRHVRPADAAGTLVFCECGQGTRVPWAAGGEAAPEPLLPILEGPAEVRPPRVQPVRPPDEARRDPGRCLNHPAAPSRAACDDCGEPFCAACLVSLQGQTLCGPCKNFYLRGLQRPPHVSGMAIGALVLSLASGPIVFILMTGLAGMRAPAVLCLLGLLPEVVAVLLGAVALRDIETDPRVSGRSLATTAMVVGVAASVLLAALTVVVRRSVE